jgi:hypothetical protein
LISIRSAESDEPLALPLPAVPLALYDVDDEADSELCNSWRNCCRMSSVELLLEESLVLSVEDEPSVGGVYTTPR